MVADQKFIRAFTLVTQDESARRAFEQLTSQIGLSGWAVAREAHLDSDVVEQSLDRLVREGVIKSSGRGLSAYYTPTGLGFALKEQLALSR